PLARPSLGDAESAAADRVLRSGRLTMGPETERFEALLATRTGRRGAVAVSSGTAALELSLRVLGVERGDEVVVSSFGFPAAASAARNRGAVPIAAEVDLATWNLTPAAVEAARGPRTRAVIAIGQLGLPGPGAALAAAAAGVPIIDDAACALGGRDVDGRPGGGQGVVATLSFHPRKVVTTGEGGAVVSDDVALLGRIRALRNHGQLGPGRWAEPGTNARLTEVGAAIGCVQLERLDAMLEE